MNAPEHPTDDLSLLLRGELRFDDVQIVSTHLRNCDECRQDLVELATAGAMLARAGRLGIVDEPAPMPTLATARVDPGSSLGEREPRRNRWLVPVAAAVAVVLVAAAAFVATRGSSPSAPVTRVALQAVGGQLAHGTVRMSGVNDSRTMQVSTDLPPAASDHYYEVWLLDTRTNGMVAVGVLPSTGRATFTLPSDLLERYDAVDLSLQPDDGKTIHSSDSVLRARYS